MSEKKAMGEKKCPHCRTKERSEDEIRDLITRLNRIEGQIRGIRKMVEEDAYCVDVLTQVSAAKCSLNSFSKIYSRFRSPPQPKPRANGMEIALPSLICAKV